MHFASLSGIGFATFIKILNKFNNVQPFTELKTDIRLVIVVIHVLAKNSVKSPHGVVHLTC